MNAFTNSGVFTFGIRELNTSLGIVGDELFHDFKGRPGGRPLSFLVKQLTSCGEVVDEQIQVVGHIT